MHPASTALVHPCTSTDGCTGRFWEGRFKCQALLDEAALLTCMTYVDLNPIRAKMADTPETSDFTSIQARIREHTTQKASKQNGNPNPESKVLPLSHFLESEHEDNPDGIPFSYADYLQLVDWTGRAVRDDKAGYIPQEIAPILERLNLNKEQWVDNIKHYDSRFKRVVGALDIILNYSKAINQQWCHGQGAMRQLYNTLAT